MILKTVAGNVMKMKVKANEIMMQEVANGKKGK